MPTYEYEAIEQSVGCEHCKNGFETMQSIHDKPLEKCPQCGAKIRKVIAAPAIGRSKSSLDQRAKSAGFKKLKRLGQGEYEKIY
jgi:putative FmdB family regulatory protein